MPRVLRWAALSAAALVLVFVVLAGYVYFNTEIRIQREYQVDPDPVAVARIMEGGAGSPAVEAASGEEGEAEPEFAADDGDGFNGRAGDTDRHGGEEEGEGVASGTVARGEHIALTRGCTDCHAEDFGGAVFADEMPVFRLSATNLTPGGVGAGYTDADWIRSIRHGIGPDNKPHLFMPSYEYYYLSDADLGALITYLKSLPTVVRTLPENAVGPLGRVLFMAGQLPLVPAEMIDHGAPRPLAPPRGVTAEYGAYLAVGCSGCHGTGFSGGTIPGVPPDWPRATNITPDPETGIGEWTREDFFRAMREGVRPDGTSLRPEFMPWPNMGRLHDDEMEALWLYLSRLEARPIGGR